MASLYKRGCIWWTKFYHRGKTIRKSLQTSNRRVARERARLLESSTKDSTFSIRAACTRTPLSHVLDDYCRHLRTTKTNKSAQTDVYYLRQIFGPVSAELQVNSRKPISSAERTRRLEGMLPKELRPGPEHLRAAFIEDLTTAEVSRVLTERVRRRGLSPKTANRLREVLHAFCAWCMTQRDVRFPDDSNPVTAVARWRETAPEIRFLEPHQIQQQLQALKAHPTLHVMVAVLIFAGLRREETVWLTHADVDLESRLIRVRAKTVSGEFWEPKTKRNRAVPISSSLHAILRGHQANGVWYFVAPGGQRWDPDNFSRTLRRVNRAAGLDWTCLHFRHTFGSMLAQNGESLYKIATLMGNSPAICQRHYAALTSDAMRASVEFDRSG